MSEVQKPNEQVEAQQANPQSPEDLTTQAKKEEVKAGAGDFERDLEKSQDANSLIQEINSLKGVENIEQRREVFMQLVDVLNKKPDDYFKLSSENFDNLVAIIMAFNTNGSFKVETNDLEKAKLAQKRIEKIIVESAGIDSSLITNGQLGIDFFDNPSNFSFSANRRQSGKTITVDTYYFTKDGVQKKEKSWEQDRGRMFRPW